jgi:hypothetical protein
MATLCFMLGVVENGNHFKGRLGKARGLFLSENSMHRVSSWNGKLTKFASDIFEPHADALMRKRFGRYTSDIENGY